MSRSGWWLAASARSGDPGHEGDRLGEGRELERLHDLVAGALPTREGGEALGDAVFGERRHAPIVDLG